MPKSVRWRLALPLLLWSASWTQPARANRVPLKNTTTHCSKFAPRCKNLPVAEKAEAAETKPAPTQDTAATFDDVVSQTRHIEGLFDLYANDETGELYLEIQPEQFVSADERLRDEGKNRPFLLVMTLSQGLGELGFLEGMPLYDVPFYLQRQNDRVFVIVPNSNFRIAPNDPQAASVGRSFSNSILYSLPVIATHPERQSVLVDLSELLVQGDLSGLSASLGELSYGFDADRSYLSQVRGFPENLEIEAILGFTGNLDGLFQTVPDGRAFSLGVRYSISQLPEVRGYQPRLADSRVGYFVTAYRDLNDRRTSDPFVRYINRWRLEKQDPNAPLSPPKKPIVFWIENTVPEAYREPIREGILLWNRAFERAGFLNAIEVRQMPDDATWDPADVRYNVIRWSTSFQSGFAGIGPSRVDPLTGEILDADILINADIVRYLSREYDTYLGGRSQRLFVDLPGCETADCASSNPLSGETVESPLDRLRSRFDRHRLGCNCRECTRQFQMGAMALSLLQGVLPDDAEMQEYVHQYLRYLVAHEVGHTLGLRHNFHGSTLLGLGELNDLQVSRTRGLSGSVMDYLPPNIAPPGVEQGDYFPNILGPYDTWAIEYGYTPIPAASPLDERHRLDEIARQSPQPDLAYGTDEDLWTEIDPAVNWFDLSGDMLEHAQSQMELARQMWKRLEAGIVLDGDPDDALRVRFDMVMGFYFRQVRVLLKYVGGQSFDRSHLGEQFAEPPFAPLSAEEQRASLAALQQYVFAEEAFAFSPNLLNQLVPTRWYHWGSTPPMERLDYPIHDLIFYFQQQVLRSLLAGERLNRLRDLELKTEPGEALTVPELFDTVYRGIWTEVLQGRRIPTDISSIRRSLQREHLNLSIEMALGGGEFPEDSRTLARFYLQELGEEISVVLRRHEDDLDTYTRAHLEDTRSRIDRSLDAQFLGL
ncbi:MAG: zinc-dependent metalloprotease [Cyanobacteria bacterium SID2]|nr:zinc-dependent metalloprotease [Cyanobacteria bacterium SID2]MBP0006008.1 zinc-dependent metalloprotease [Cyanobacteria bacterium SBC]